jgi:predicted type IV restriction endonuclease
MDFAERIRDLSLHLQKQLPHIQTEEATKNALIMPFISALGYNVFDPTEVTPELHADVGLKKGEKVDYAILRDGKPIILFECKWHGADLNKEHASQLYRYFSVTEARFSVLTNGIIYRFYTDLEAPNKMDAKHFFEFNLTNYRDTDIEELKKFSKSAYDLTDILNTASELKYAREIQRIMAEQMQNPSEEFVRFFAAQLYPGRMTQAIRQQFTQTTQRALRQFITDQINERLKSALGVDHQLPPEKAPPPVPAPALASSVEEDEEKVVTSSDEMEAFYTIRAMLHHLVGSKRVAMRDVQTYCGILLDNNNRKPICRLYFNGSQKYLGLFDNDQRKEARVPIGDVDELHHYADRLTATIKFYEK